MPRSIFFLNGLNNDRGRLLLNGSLPRQLEQRLTFDNRAIIGECVKRLNEQACSARLEIDVTDGTQRYTAARIKRVQHALALAVLNKIPLE